MGAITTELVPIREKRDRRGRRMKPRSGVQRWSASYKASGLAQAALTRHEGQRNSTFAYWVLQLTKEEAEGRKRPIEFAQLRLPVPSPLAPITAEPARLEVRLPDGILFRSDNANDLAVRVRGLRA